MNRFFTFFGLLLMVLPIGAQEMAIQDFVRLKKGLLNFRHVPVDKKQALFDLKTGEQGFTFLADGVTEAQVEEGDGLITVKLPHKTKFIVVKHPKYGQLTWKSPVKKLKKKNRYEAFLFTNSPDKEYKVDKQWVVFDIKPHDAVVTVDSTVALVRTGSIQFYLPLGKHAYQVESPFHQKVEDTFELTDSVGLTIPVELQPFYSYLTVKSGLEGSQIFVDGLPIGFTQATSGRLNEGSHRVTVFLNEHCYYDGNVAIGRAEKKTLELRQDQLQMREWKEKKRTSDTVQADSASQAGARAADLSDALASAEQAAANRQKTASVSIEALDDSTEIFVNKESVGFGKWEGQLAQGFYAITSAKDGVESSQQFLWIDDDFPRTVVLNAPLADYGVLNIHGNEIGAEIYINKSLVGLTPCVVSNLPARKRCKIRLKKPGYKDATASVTVIGNDLVDVEINMKKR